MKQLSIQSSQQNLFEVEPIDPAPMRAQRVEHDYAFDIVDALQSPILTFSQPWADTIPQRFLDIVQLARLKALMNGYQTATDPECVIYIYTRTLEGPMDGDWTDIYTYITCKTMADWFKEDHREEVKAPAQLSQWLSSKLDGLRRHIYDKRRQMLKARMRR